MEVKQGKLTIFLVPVAYSIVGTVRVYAPTAEIAESMVDGGDFDWTDMKSDEMTTWQRMGRAK